MTSTRGSKELFSGLLYKCGGKIKSWNKRWFVLKDDYCLYYFKDIAKGHLGVISLRDTKFKVRKGHISDCSWPKGVDMSMALAVVTNQRTFFMYSTTADDATGWIRMLEATRDKLMTESREINRLLNPKRPLSLVKENDKGQRHLADLGRPLSDPSLMKDEPHPQETDRQLTYDEIVPTVEDSMASQISADDPDSFYDVAKPLDNTVEQGLYMDIGSAQSDKPTFSLKSVSPTDPGGPSSLYDDVAFVADDITCQGTYDLVKPESSIQSQPLPPLPTAVVTSSTPQPIYEDIGTDDQPVYECVDLSSEKLKEAQFEDSTERSVSPNNMATLPPLPPKDDVPPLPPKDDVPPLPPKHDIPPLPPKDDLPPPKKVTPPLTTQDESMLQSYDSDTEVTNYSNKSKAVLPSLILREDLPALPSCNEQDNFYDVIEVHTQNLQLADLSKHSGSPPSPCQVNKTPPSPHRVNKTPPSPHRVNKTPPSPHQVNETPPSPHRVNTTPPSPHRVNKTPPSPHRVNTTPPPPHRANKTPPSPHQVNNTPPSSCQVDKDGTPSSPHQVENIGILSTKRDMRKPSPTPRRKLPNATVSPVESKPRAQTTSTSPPPVEGTPQSPDRGGMSLFLSRQERCDQLSNVESKRRANTILLMDSMTSDPSMSVKDKSIFAETLREMEHERLQASEEKFRWERERMKFEEEKRKFEAERIQMLKELESAKK